MKIEKIKNLIRETLAEVKSAGYVVIDLDRSRGAFDGGDDLDESPIDPVTGDVHGQWEHITNKSGDETGHRYGWETAFSVFPNRAMATQWAIQHLKGKNNPVTGKPFRFQVLAYAQWGAELDRQQKAIGTSRDKEFQPAGEEDQMLGLTHDDREGQFEQKEDFHDGLARELGNAKKERNAEKIAYYTQALRNSNQTAVASFDKQFKGSWAYDGWVKKSAKDIAAAAADLKRFAWLREVVNEAVAEVMREGSLPAGIPANHIMSVEEFMKDAQPDEVNEADMLGAKTTDMSPEDMQNFLGQTKGKTLAPADKYKMPYVHGSNITIKNDAGQKYDTEKLKAAIVRRPTQILKKNEKMGKSAGPNTTFFNIGLPALKGLAVNEKTNEFVIVDVCPGAGACKVYCYARKGGYIQYKDASMSQTRLLNYILNDPAGFKKQFETELAKEVASAKKHGKEIVIRWHDAGDFFSPDYLTLAYSIAKDFPDVKFYAYTKMAGVAVGQKPDNFIMNFSMGATPEQEKQIDFAKTKHSTVVPKQMFDQFMQKDEKGKLVRDEKKRMQFIDDAALEAFKVKLGQKHNIKPESIITYDDLLKTPVDKELNKYNVIIRPGDGDISASRPDVKGTYLLIH